MNSTREIITLEFEVQAEQHHSGKLPANLRPWIGEAPLHSRVQVEYQSGRLRSRYHGEGGERGGELGIDLVTKESIIVDPEGERHLVLDQGPGPERRGAGVRYERLSTRRERFDLEGKEYSATCTTYWTGGAHLDVWACTGVPSPSELGRALWDLLLPGAPKLEGLPVRIDLREEDGGPKLGSLQLVGLQVRPAKDAGLVLARSGRRVEGVSLTAQPSTHQKKGAPARGSEVRDIGRARRLSRRSKKHRSDALRIRHALRGKGQDFAFAMDQDFLDRVRDLVNSLSGAFDTFYGDGEGGDKPMHVELDWWEQLESHLKFGTAATTQEVLETVRSLYLYYKVSQGAPLVADTDQMGGLNPAEQQQYSDALDAAQEDTTWIQIAGLPAARVIHFRETFGGSRRSSLAAAEFASFTKIDDLELYDAEVTLTDIDFLDMKLWDFDATIEIGNGDLLESLEFKQDKIRASVTLKHFNVDFQYATWPDGSLGSILCNILSLGMCSLLQSQYGYGSASVDDAHIVFDILPVPSQGEIGFTVDVDRDASSMDVSVFTLGVNPIRDLIEWTLEAVLSWWREDLVEDHIYPILEKKLEEVANSELWKWASVWHAKGAPDGLGTAALFSPGAGVLEGDLAAYIPGLPQGVAAPVQTDPAKPFAYVFSARYLTAWLRENLPMLDGAAFKPVQDLQSALGIELVDPESLETGGSHSGQLGTGSSGFEFHCDGVDATPPPDYANRVGFLRSAAVVSLPPQGEQDRAGTLSLQYQFRVEAVKTTYRSFSILVQEPCGTDHPGSGRGPIPDPVPFRLAPGGDPLPLATRPLFPSRRTTLRRSQGLAAKGLYRRAKLQARIGGERPLHLGNREPISLRAGESLGYSAPGQSWGGGALGGGSLGGWTGGGAPGGGPDDGPGGGVGGGFGGDPSGIPDRDPSDLIPGGGHACPPPYCESFSSAREQVLKTYVDMTLTVEARLLVGFNEEFTAFWIPEVRLGIDQDDDGPKLSLSSQLHELDLDVDSDQLIQFVEALCLEDAQLQLSQLTSQGVPPTEVSLIPDAASLIMGLDQVSPEAQSFILDAFHFRQASGGALSYVSDGNLVYWGAKVDENLSSHIT